MSRFSHRAEVLYSNRAKVLGLFADILDYPAPGLASKTAECAALIGAVQPQAAALLESFRGFAEENSLGRLQEVYSGFFDLNSICHPYVGYQLFGENYKRSTFLVGLKKSYRDEGFEASATEIPDRLSIVLRFAAQSKGEDVDALLGKGLLPALERMTTKPETEGHTHGPADIDGDTGVERAKLDDREERKQRKEQAREARNQLNGQSVAGQNKADDRNQLKGQGHDMLEGGFLLAMSEDYDVEDVEKRQHPYHQALDALRLLLHEGMTKKGADRSAEQERVLGWTRERFKLDEDETIMVSELPCSDPGCPPVETHVVFWTQAGRQHFKIFKPLAEVEADDLLDWQALEAHSVN